MMFLTALTKATNYSSRRPGFTGLYTDHLSAEVCVSHVLTDVRLCVFIKAEMLTVYPLQDVEISS